VPHLHYSKRNEDARSAQILVEHGGVDVRLTNRELVSNECGGGSLAHLRVTTREALPVRSEQIRTLAFPVVRRLAHKALVHFPRLWVLTEGTAIAEEVIHLIWPE